MINLTEYFIIYVDKFDNIINNSLDEWIYFLKNEEIKSNFKAQGLDKAKETLDIMQLKGEERLKYQRYIERRRDEKSFEITKKIELEEAKEKGKKEREIEIAKNLLLAKVDMETIVKSTGLTIEEIENL